MAKKLRKKDTATNWANYCKGDELIDLLREYHGITNNYISHFWIEMCKRDMENMRARRKKRINEKRRYK